MASVDHTNKICSLSISSDIPIFITTFQKVNSTMNPSNHIRHITMPVQPVDDKFPKISRPKTDLDDIQSDRIEYCIEKLDQKKRTFVGIALWFEENPKVDWTIHVDEDPKNDLAITIKDAEKPIKITKRNTNDLICEFILRSDAT
jgi:hypothetical protein